MPPVASWSSIIVISASTVSALALSVRVPGRASLIGIISLKVPSSVPVGGVAASESRGGAYSLSTLLSLLSALSLLFGSSPGLVELPLDAFPLASEAGHAHLHEVPRVALVLLNGHVRKLD